MADSKENYYNWDLGIEGVNKQDGFVMSAKEAQKEKNWDKFFSCWGLAFKFWF